MNIPSIPNPDTASSELHQLRINSMIKTIILQRDSANNQLVKLSSDLAVSEAQVAQSNASLSEALVRNTSLISSNSLLSSRVLQLEDSSSELARQNATYLDMIEQLRSSEAEVTPAPVPTLPVALPKIDWKESTSSAPQ